MSKNELVKNEKDYSTAQIVKQMLAADAYKNRFAQVLGAKAEKFTGNIVTAVSGSKQLSECDPTSIVAASFVAATLDLSIDPNLGFAALVPYRTKKGGEWATLAQFQMMYRGMIQLAIRTGQYEHINCTEVYGDEMLGFNPIKGRYMFIYDRDVNAMSEQRMTGNPENVIGYYASFRLLSGYEHELFMTKDEVKAHAMRYSQAYNYDLKNGKKSSPWSTNFDEMGKKTLIKRLLSKWGVMSIDMQTAAAEDQKVYRDIGVGEYEDNQPVKETAEAHDPFANAAEPEMTRPEPVEEVSDVDDFEVFDMTS